MEYEDIFEKADELIDCCCRLFEELEKKDEIIDLMAEYLCDYDTSISQYLYRENGNCDKEMIKQYFERKVKE